MAVGSQCGYHPLFFPKQLPSQTLVSAKLLQAAGHRSVIRALLWLSRRLKLARKMLLSNAPLQLVPRAHAPPAIPFVCLWSQIGWIKWITYFLQRSCNSFGKNQNMEHTYCMIQNNLFFFFTLQLQHWLTIWWQRNRPIHSKTKLGIPAKSLSKLLIKLGPAGFRLRRSSPLSFGWRFILHSSIGSFGFFYWLSQMAFISVCLCFFL